MKRPALPILFVLVAFAGCVAVAHANYIPKHGHPCKAGYTRKVRKVRKHERKHGKLVWVRVRETVCVETPKPTVAPTPPTPTPAPVVTAPTTITIGATIDPSFTQNPINPLDVTYTYNATATTTTNGVTTNDPSLPAGILNLYSDGLLICSNGVGNTTTTEYCQVVYSAYGVHTIIVTYQAGTTSATQTLDEVIQPLAATVSQLPATTMTETVYSFCQPGMDSTPNVIFSACVFTVAATLAGQNGPLPDNDITFSAPCTNVTDDGSAETCTITYDELVGCSGTAGAVMASFAGDADDAPSSATEPLTYNNC